MRKNEEFAFEIYHNGVHFKAPVRSRARFLREREFLDNLVGWKYPPSSLPRPVPDPTADFYMLTDEQLDAYSAFRREQYRQEHGF